MVGVCAVIAVIAAPTFARGDGNDPSSAAVVVTDNGFMDASGSDSGGYLGDDHARREGDVQLSRPATTTTTSRSSTSSRRRASRPPARSGAPCRRSRGTRRARAGPASAPFDAEGTYPFRDQGHYQFTGTVIVAAPTPPRPRPPRDADADAHADRDPHGDADAQRSAADRRDRGARLRRRQHDLVAGRLRVRRERLERHDRHRRDRHLQLPDRQRHELPQRQVLGRAAELVHADRGAQRGRGAAATRVRAARGLGRRAARSTRPARTRSSARSTRR